MSNIILFLLQADIPNTSGYMIAGYLAIFGIIILYLVSLIIRFRYTQQDYERLTETTHVMGDRPGL